MKHILSESSTSIQFHAIIDNDNNMCCSFCKFLTNQMKSIFSCNIIIHFEMKVYFLQNTATTMKKQCYFMHSSINFDTTQLAQFIITIQYIDINLSTKNLTSKKTYD